MKVRDAMIDAVVTVPAGETLAHAARQLAERNIGAALVADLPAPGVIAESDVVAAVGAGNDPRRSTVADHCTTGLETAAPEWSLEDAAAAMMRANVAHLPVSDGRGSLVGVVSMREIVRAWLGDHLQAM